MQSQLFGLLLLAVFAFVHAVPSILVEDEAGQQYYLSPVLSRVRRADPEIFGEGGGNSQQQGGYAGLKNPDGSGAKVAYDHANGYGHTVSVDALVPVWSNKDKFGETTLSVGGGTTHRFGGYGGSDNLDKRVMFNINRTW